MLETSISGAGDIVHLSWDSAHHINVVSKQLGVDEKSLAKGQRYATMLCDLEHGHVIDLAEVRTKASLLHCLGKFSMNQLADVQAIAMDMREPYAQVFRAVVENADEKIVFIAFTHRRALNAAVDQVRRRENKRLRLEGDDSLVGSNHLWLYGGTLPAAATSLLTARRLLSYVNRTVRPREHGCSRHRYARSGRSVREWQGNADDSSGTGGRSGRASRRSRRSTR